VVRSTRRSRSLCFTRCRDSDFQNVARIVDCQDAAGANCNPVCDKLNIDYNLHRQHAHEITH
jgi:hypothetical protein